VLPDRTAPRLPGGVGHRVPDCLASRSHTGPDKSRRETRTGGVRPGHSQLTHIY
jgi:hypothetical protein